MTSYADPLSLSRKALRLLVVLNQVGAALILAGLVGSVVAREWVMTALGATPAPGNEARILAMQQIAVLGLLSAPLAHVVLSRLLQIVNTVREGDAFVAENAVRLQRIAWSLLGMELLHLVVGVTAAVGSSETVPLDVGWEFSFTRWLAVLLLFVLARVFAEGTRMREELEGTV